MGQERYARSFVRHDDRARALGARGVRATCLGLGHRPADDCCLFSRFRTVHSAHVAASPPRDHVRLRCANGSRVRSLCCRSICDSRATHSIPVLGRTGLGWIGSLHRPHVPFCTALRRVALAAPGTLVVGLSGRLAVSRLRVLCRLRGMGHPTMVAYDLRTDHRLCRGLLDACLATKDTGDAWPCHCGVNQACDLRQRAPLVLSDRPAAIPTVCLRADVHHDRVDPYRPLRKIAQRHRKT
ncbi:hypothetical protein ACVWW7_003213 [Bradyrhizobium sp. LM6.9]